MMYVALTYDHRIIDGREAVDFLVRIKECVEDPSRLLFDHMKCHPCAASPAKAGVHSYRLRPIWSRLSPDCGDHAMPERYDVVVIGAGPGGYVAAIRAAQLGMRHGLHRQPRDARRHLPQYRLHPVEGAAAIVGEIRRGAARARRARDQGRRGGARSRRDDGRKDKVVDDPDPRRRVPVPQEQGRLAEGRARIAAPGRVALARATGGAGGRGRRDHHRDRLGEHPAARDRDRRAADRVLDRRAGARPRAGAAGGDRRRLYRARTRLGVGAARRQGHGRRISSTASCPAWTASSARHCSGCWRARASRSSSATKVAAARRQRRRDAGAGAGDGRRARTLAADVVLVAIGRRPFTDGLGLDEIGVARDARAGSRSTTDFATNVPGIYAIGDVIRGPMLAHKAEEEGVACVERLAGQKTAGRVRRDPGGRLHLARGRRRSARPRRS